MEALLKEKMLDNLPTTLKERANKLPTPLHGYTGEKRKEILKQGGMDRQDRTIPQGMKGHLDYIRYQPTKQEPKKDAKKDAKKVEKIVDGKPEQPKPQDKDPKYTLSYGYTGNQRYVPSERGGPVIHP